VALDDRRIDAFCLCCKQERILISGWQYTDWAAGHMDPISLDEPREH
jgi:hypothetical protein